MSRNNTNVPAQSISVDFVRLSELGEYENLRELLTCKLCDSITVIFPMYGVRASFKIVRTEWDVLADRYNGMELGSLRTTLAEALGTQTETTGGASGGSIGITVGGNTYPITRIMTTTVSGVSGVLVQYDDGSIDGGSLFFADGIGLNAVKTALENRIITGSYVYRGSSATTFTFTDSNISGKSFIICGTQDAGNPVARASINGTEVTVYLDNPVTVMRVNYICF